MSSSNPLEKLTERSEALAASGFQEDERHELARLIIRKHDADHRAHCAKVCIVSFESILGNGVADELWRGM